MIVLLQNLLLLGLLLSFGSLICPLPVLQLYPTHIVGSSFDVYASVTTTKPLAVIISASSFHLEITAFFAYQLSHLFNYEVHLWTIGPSFWDSYGNTLVSPYVDKVFYFQHPYLSHRIENYDKFSSLPLEIEVLVYITAEREISFFQKNHIYSIHVSLLNRSKRVLMVNHHSDDIRGLIPYCQRKDNCTITHLSKHVYMHSQSFLNETEKTFIHNCYLYPLFNLSSILKDEKWNIEKEKIKLNQIISERENGIIELVLPGKIRNGRRHYNELFECLTNITTNSLPSSSLKKNKIHLTIVGFGAKALKIPSNLRSQISRYDRISHELFYSLIANAHYMLSFFHPQQHYDTWRASSIVPAALMLNVPIILTKEYLRLYPCLLEQPHHQRLAQDSFQTNNSSLSKNCASLNQAITFTQEDRMILKKELKECENQYHQRNYEVLKSIISSSFSSIIDL